MHNRGTVLYFPIRNFFSLAEPVTEPPAASPDALLL